MSEQAELEKLRADVARLTMLLERARDGLAFFLDGISTMQTETVRRGGFPTIETKRRLAWTSDDFQKAAHIEGLKADIDAELQGTKK